MNTLISFGSCLLVVCLTVTFEVNTCSAADVSDKAKEVSIELDERHH